MFFLRSNNISRMSYLLALILVLPLVACSGSDGGLGSGSETFSWVAPSEREDGTALSLSAIAGYRIYYGVETGKYQGRIEINDQSATQAKITGIPSGTYFAVMTTVDTNGRESSFSAPEIEVTF